MNCHINASSFKFLRKKKIKTAYHFKIFGVFLLIKKVPFLERTILVQETSIYCKKYILFISFNSSIIRFTFKKKVKQPSEQQQIVLA